MMRTPPPETTLTPPELDRLLAAYTPSVRELFLQTRRAILAVRPDATEKVYMGWKNVGYGVGPAMAQMACSIGPLRERVNVHFARGTELPDPHGLLEGTGKSGRHVKVATPADATSPAFAELVAAAFALAADGAPRRPVEPTRAPDAYQVGASKTVRVPVQRLYAAFTDEALRRRWLDDDDFTVRSGTPGKSLRVGRRDGSVVELRFTAKGDDRSMVALDQRRLPDDAAIERMRAFWKERFAALARVLEG